MDLMWFKYDKNRVKVGLSAKGIKSFGQIWTFIPRVKVGDKIALGQAIATIESTFFVKSVLSPINGVLESISPILGVNPEDIEESTELFVLKASDALQIL